MSQNLQELRIAMLGASGVGKTSLLTAMYEQFDSTIGQVGLQLIPDIQSDADLQDRLGELKGLLNSFKTTEEEGLRGDDQPNSFIFDLGQKGAEPSIRLRFQDFPGGWMNATADNDDQKFVDKLINESHVILIAVDTPALIEAKGKWNDLRNRPKQIKNLFARNYTNMTSPRLIIFAPVRCEKYMQDTIASTNLLKRIREEYADLLEFFKQDTINPWIASVVTPVQTVGTVIFSEIKVVDNKPEFYFRKINKQAGYSPQDSDQPLRYILRFVLKMTLAEKSSGWLGFLREIFGFNKYLKTASSQAAEGCKLTSGFTVLQGQNLLNLDKE